MFWTIIMVLVIILDQVTKKIVIHNLDLGDSIEIIPGVFEICHTTNDGASWGMLSGGRWFFIITTIIIVVGAFVWLKKKKPTQKTLLFGVSLIIGGAIGNLIDRVFLKEVTDFLYFSLIDFPVFNVADVAITIGTILLCVYLLFFSDNKKEGKKRAR